MAALQPVIATVSQRIPILQQRMGRRLDASVLLLGLAAVLSRPLLLMVFPGILLVHMSWWKQRYLSDFIPMYSILPLFYALYPERVALLLVLPFALGIAALFDRARQLLGQKDFMFWGVAALIFLAAVRHNEQLLRHGLIANALVTPADLQAMRWIQENTEAHAVFHNRYGDAGLWLPAIAVRGITEPHLNPFYFDEFRAASSELNARYIYVDKKKLRGAPIAIEEFEARPDLYYKAYDYDAVRIY